MRLNDRVGVNIDLSVAFISPVSESSPDVISAGRYLKRISFPGYGFKHSC